MAIYLVTGVAGFIASKVAELLLAEGHTVVGVDNLNDYYDVRLKLYRLGQLMRQAGASEAEVRRYTLDVKSSESSARPTSNSQPLTFNRFEFRVLDIENLPALEEVFKAHKFEAVFNLAARAGVRASLENPEIYRTTNVVGEENVLKCQVKFGVKKHVLASSSSVYAGCPMPFTEDMPLGKMQSPYAETKRQAELLAKAYHEKHGLDVTVLRYFTVFGPAGRPDMAPFRFIKWIDEGTPITLYGDGSAARDFTYIDDIARGTILAGQLRGGKLTQGRQDAVPEPRTSNVQPLTPRFEVINLGGGNRPLTINAMIKIIEDALSDGQRTTDDGRPIEAKIKREPANPADMDATSADITKAKRLLGWKPEVSPREGFQRAVAWYAANRDWAGRVAL